MNAQGTQITFSSGFAASIRRMSLTVSRDGVNVTKLDAAAAQALDPNGLYHVEQMELEALFDASIEPPDIEGEPEAVTILWPGGITLWLLRGFIESWKILAPVNDLLAASFKVKCTGPLNVTGSEPVINDDFDSVFNDDGDLVYAVA